jgi:hypothetical protein
MFALPFSSDEFFGVFTAYNERFVLVAILLWLAMLLSVAYHALLFSAITPGAWLFAAGFTLQVALFSAATTRGLADHAYPAVPSFGVPCPTGADPIAA